MEKILVSACLYGTKCRYDGKDNTSPFLVDVLSKHYDLVAYCPEVEGGLPIPRHPAEIQKDGHVVNDIGEDVTKNYEEGAKKALTLCRYYGIKIAILKDGSPACGPRKIHDGSFKGNKIDGLGVTARLLIANGIKVYAETDALNFLIPEDKEGKKQEEGVYVSAAEPKNKPRYGFKKRRPFDKKRSFKGKR